MIWWGARSKRDVFSLSSPPDTLREFIFHPKNGRTKKSRRNSQTERKLGRIVRGLSINKDFLLFADQTIRKSEEEKSEQQNWKAKDVFIILFYRNKTRISELATDSSRLAVLLTFLMLLRRPSSVSSISKSLLIDFAFPNWEEICGWFLIFNFFSTSSFIWLRRWVHEHSD